MWKSPISLPLQWSHGFHAVERKGFVNTVLGETCLQWSHDFHAVESPPSQGRAASAKCRRYASAANESDRSWEKWRRSGAAAGQNVAGWLAIPVRERCPQSRDGRSTRARPAAL